MRIVVVGAGVAGCIIARSLSRIPEFEVHCLERAAEDDHSGAGTGLNIGPNAVTALCRHDAPLADAITAAAFPWRHWRTSLVGGRVLMDMAMSEVAGNDGWRIRWSELYRVLRQATPGIAYGCDIRSIDEDPRDAGKTSIEWTQHKKGHRLDGIDLLISADGRYSRTRQIFAGEPEVHHVGVAISRLLVPDTSNGLIDDYEQWFNGPNRLLAFRVPPDHIYIACAFPIAPDKPIADHLKSGPALRDAFTPPDGNLTPQTRWLVDTIAAGAGEMHWARLQEHACLYADPSHAVLYLGDAAHGMVPTLGQGATQAIEDACIASAILARDLAASAHSVRDVIHSIGAVRSPRMKFVMELSLKATDTMLAGADPVSGTLHKTEPAFLAKLRQLYEDIPGFDRLTQEAAI